MAIMPALAQDTQDSAPPPETDFASGKVVKIISESGNKLLEQSFGGNQTVQLVQVKILNGKLKGKTVEIENQLTANPAYDIKVKPGSRVILDIEKNGKSNDIYISDLERFPALLIMTGLFFMLLMIIGGMRGLKSLISVSITSGLVFFAFIPAILNNFPIIPTAVGISLLSTLFTMFLVGGINIKSVAATLGTISGLIIAGLAATLVIKLAPLSGLYDQEAIMLWTSRPDLNFAGILTAAMIVGALGAIMDIGMSIASCIAELKLTDPDLSAKQLIKSGMNVGIDIMGTMANTLILAYIGGALPLILLAYNAPLFKLINLNPIATEISAALAGSIGIVLCVPITAVISGYLIGKSYSKKI